VKLTFAHEVRTRLSLDRVATLDVLDDLDAYVDTLADVQRDRRQAARGLRRLAWDEQASDAELRARLTSVMEAETAGRARVTGARDKVLSHLSAEQAARFLVMEPRLQREMRREMLDLLRPDRMGPPPGRPGEPGGPDQESLERGPAPLRRPPPAGPPDRR
jgi:hypothetical protein